MQRLVRLLRVDSSARCAERNAEAATKTGASAICAEPANNNTNMKTEMIKPSCRRMKDGWAAAIEYEDGGWIIMSKRFGTMGKAVDYARFTLDCINDDEELRIKRPAPNQLIDLQNAEACHQGSEKRS
jgi:hypothetical protein